MWRLKKNQPPFEVVDGPMTGRQFAHGLEYSIVPPGQEHRFEHSGEAITIIAAIGSNNTAEISPALGKKDKKDKEEVANA